MIRALIGRPARLRAVACVVGAAMFAGAPAAAQVGDIIDPGPPPGGDSMIPAATEDLFRAVALNDFAAAQAAVAAAGAEVDAVDRFGLSPIDIAIDKGHYQIAHFLLSVRNFRPSAGDELPPRFPAAAAPPAAGPARATRQAAPPRSAAPPGGDAAVTPDDALAALPPADPAADDARFAWPEDEPNPFDPGVPVFGGVLPEPGAAR